MTSRITFEKITVDNFDRFYTFLAEDFPYEERKTYENELKTLANDKFKANFILVDGKIIGYLCYWEFDKIIYAEHFAILQHLRNQGKGTKFFQYFADTQSKPLIIEVERPIDEITNRRINFYKRLGFVINNFDYYQPSYHGGDDKVPMLILSYKKKIPPSQFKDFFKTIKSNVYI